MLASTQDNSYFERMAMSLKDKVKIFPFLQPGKVLDAGAGGGELTAALIDLGFSAYALDGSKEAINHLREKKIPAYQNFTHEVASIFPPETYENVVCSSILHEVFSYGDNSANSAFTVRSLENSLQQFHQVLKPQGKLIIRDGIAPRDRSETITVHFKDEDGIRMAEKYLAMIPFKKAGTPSAQHEVDFAIDKESSTIQGDAHSIMEFLYTYTWGEGSYPRETQEVYGVFTLDEYVTFLELRGFAVIHAEEYLQDGYPAHLRGKVRLSREDGSEAPFPMSNCLIVAEKR